MTKKLPTSEGYYWWVQKYDGEIVTKRVLWVRRYKERLYASDEEYNFIIKESLFPDPDEQEFWQKIEEPSNP